VRRNRWLRIALSSIEALESGAERRTPNGRERFHAVLKNIVAIWRRSAPLFTGNSSRLMPK
jgi:hypothetical protein